MIDLGYSGYIDVELSPEIGGGAAVKGDSAPPIEELKKAYDMFCRFEDG